MTSRHVLDVSIANDICTVWKLYILSYITQQSGTCALKFGIIGTNVSRKSRSTGFHKRDYCPRYCSHKVCHFISFIRH